MSFETINPATTRICLMNTIARSAVAGGATSPGGERGGAAADGGGEMGGARVFFKQKETEVGVRMIMVMERDIR